MFYGKRISELEEEVKFLEERVQMLNDIATEQGKEIDKLYELFAKQEATKVQSQKPKPKYRPRRNNGKETPKASE